MSTRNEIISSFYGQYDEAVRITKPGGVLMFAFISVFAIMYANYFYGNWALGQKENFTDDYRVKHFKEQLFTGYDVTEFEGLFKDKPVELLGSTNHLLYICRKLG